MLKWTTTFFIVAIAAYLFGFGQIEGPVASTAQVLFFISACLAVVTFFAFRPEKRNDTNRR